MNGPTRPTAEEMLTGLMHHKQLVDACQRHGDLGEADDARGLRTMQKVTGILLKDRERQRLQQRDEVHGLLIHVLSDAYRTIKDGSISTTYDIQERILEAFDVLGIRPTDDELDVLVMPWKLADGFIEGADDWTIRGRGGPVAAAEAVLAIRLVHRRRDGINDEGRWSRHHARSHRGQGQRRATPRA